MKKLTIIIVFAIICTGVFFSCKSNDSKAIKEDNIVLINQVADEKPSEIKADIHTEATGEMVTLYTTNAAETTEEEATIEPTTEPAAELVTEAKIPEPTTEDTRLNGIHLQTYANGDKYEGNFVSGIRSGQGAYTWADDVIYIGEFVNGEPNGNGTYIYPATEPPPVQTPTEPLTQAPAPNDSVYTVNVNNYDSQGKDKKTLDYYLLPTPNIQSGDEKIINLAKSIVDGKTKEYDKAQAIFDWITTNIWQETEWWTTGNYTFDAVSVIDRKRAMCINISNLAVALFRALDMPAKIIDLEDGNPIKHTFCEAFVDGKWLVMNMYFGNKNIYKDGEFQKALPNDRRFFDLSVQDMWNLRNHFGRKYIDFSYYVREKYFFGDGRIENIVLPDEFTAIGKLAFSGCSNLRSIYIPKSVTFIADDAFRYCTNLTIFGEAGSYAETYAKEKDIKFETGS